jgi:3-oxoacyl-[acyl-carrier protein] reductase
MDGKRAIVTGGSRGIGRAIVGALLAEGAAVTLCGRTAESAARAVAELATPNVHGIGADVSREEDVAALFRFAQERMGGVDILVASAGIGVFQPSGDMPIEDWKRTVEINLTGAFLCSRMAVQAMRGNGGGFIVHVSSLAGTHPFAGGAAYSASKAAMNAMSESMMLDHRHDNIRVTTIAPGSVDTEFSRSSGKVGEWKVQPQDVARMVVAVLSMPERTLVSRVEMRPSRPPK